MALVLGFGFSLFTALIVILGDYLIKLAADGGHPIISTLVMTGCALYAASALLWFFALHHVTLSTGGGSILDVFPARTLCHGSALFR